MRQLARHLYHDSATDLRIALAESSSFGQGRHAVGQALARHQLRLAAFVEQLARSTTDAGQDFVYREAVCGSYSTEAQLAVLGLVQPRAPAEHEGRPRKVTGPRRRPPA